MKNIGIIVADRGEFQPLIDKIDSYENIGYFGRDCCVFKLGGYTVYAVLCGIGKVNASSAAMFLYHKNCDIILNYGYSGGISGVRKGDTVIADSFLEHDFDLVCLGYKPCEKPEQEYIYSADKQLTELLYKICSGAKCGLAVSGDRFISDDKLRCSLRDMFNAVSCDMETAAIASVCHQTGMRFACVRQISDDAGNDAAVLYRDEANSGNIAPADCIITLINSLKELV